MSKQGFRIELGGAWKSWTKPSLGKTSGGTAQIETAGQAFFDASQRVVHVITGRLKGSGDLDVTNDGDRIVATVSYDAPYAVTEAARGGPHDFMQRAYEETYEEFPKAVAEALDDIVSREFS